MRWLLPLCALATAVAGGSGGALADELDGWCAQVKKASSIVICSDAELRQQAIDRNKLFDAARAKLSPEAYKALTVDQAQWIKGYTARCGISIADPPPLMPIPQTVIDCYRRESRARTAYLAGYLSEPNPTAPLPPPASALPPASPAPAATTCADPAPHDDRCSPEDLNVGAIAHVRRIGGARGCFSIEDFSNKNGSGCRTVYPYESLTVKDIQGDYDVVASPPSGFANPLDVVYVIYSDLARGPPLASKPPEPSKPVEAAPVVPTAPANADSAPWLKYQTPSARDEIALVEANGVYKVPVVINGVLPLQFVLDSGAADVSLPADVFSTLRRTGTISDADYIGRGKYRLADGSTVQSDEFFIHELSVGNRVLRHVAASIGDMQSPLLLGQSFLKRFTSVDIDNARHVLALGPEGPDAPESATLPRLPPGARLAPPADNPFAKYFPADIIPVPPPGATPLPPGFTETPIQRPAVPSFDPTKPYTVVPQGSNVAPVVPIDITKLKLTEVSLAYGPLLPNVFKFIVANAGSQKVSQLTIGYHEVQGRCTANLSDYDGFKKFSADHIGRPLDLTAGDSVVLETQFSANARGFCIISAR